jgi:predicted AAA+ superfamily ATPase
LSLNSLAKKPVSPDAFFAENHMTQGMRVLLTEGFKRLEGRSDQGVFRLTQAMGGGKTHNLIAFGLLAQHPEHRAPVMGGFHTPAPGLGKARVITFSGRESDSPYGIWGAIAQQVGRLEFFQQYYSPLSAPGETAWANLLKGEPTVVMLDELPPYFEYARSKPIGDSNLAVVTGTALANLLVAVTEELPQCCVIITDLKASYEGGTQQLSAALRNLDQETDRVALDLEPVRLASDEFYHILRKRIFETLPSADEVAEVAQGYVKALREARQMDVTSVSPEQFGTLVEASYPFHPSIRDLYARFKENQGFQQTRGLIRLRCCP